jgi:hypothetical protein
LALSSVEMHCGCHLSPVTCHLVLGTILQKSRLVLPRQPWLPATVRVFLNGPLRYTNTSLGVTLPMAYVLAGASLAELAAELLVRLDASAYAPKALENPEQPADLRE